MEGGWVYIMTNRYRTVLYTGVTNNIDRRVWEHAMGLGGEFTRKYRCDRLVYCEQFRNIRDAIAEEKRIKKRSRKAKIELIESVNPEWNDLSDVNGESWSS